MKYTSKLILNWTEYEFGAVWGGGWQPWANTIAYYPLTSTTTVNDMSWNNRTLTWTWNYAFGTYAWVDCCYFNVWMLSASIPDIQDNDWFTLNIWYNEKSAPNYDNGWVLELAENNYPDSPNWIVRTKWRPNSSYWVVWYISWTLWNPIITTSFNWTLWAWHNYCYTQENWIGVFYTDGVQIWTLTFPYNHTRNMLHISRKTGYDRSIIWYVSNAIYENKVWNAQEISAYFDQTKSLYWIS